MIITQHIKQIENILNKEKIINYKLLQISFDIACLKFELSSKKKYIAKFSINKKNTFNPIKSEAENLKYLNKKFDFFPKVIKFNDAYLIIQYIENDKKKPNNTNFDFLNAVVKLHSVSNDQYGFIFSTQMGALEQINSFERSWTNFYVNKRLYPILELANKKENIGSLINEKILFIIKNIDSFIPNNPPALLLHGDMWEGNILFKKERFVGFIDPGSFYGHNEMEVAYLRWFNPSFIDKFFIEKYSNFINLDKNYFSYEPVYQLYYSLCNVALWDKSYIEETKRLLIKLKI